MKKARIFKENANINIQDISKFEKKIKLLFPKDYKDFILEYNGAEVESNSNLYSTVPNDDEDNFFHIDKFTSWEESIDFIGYYEECPKYWHLIGESCMSGYYFISLHKNDYGYIYFLDPPHEDFEDAHLIFKSFSELINNLFREPEATDFYIYIDRNEYKLLKELYEKKEIDINEKDSLGKNALEYLISTFWYDEKNEKFEDFKDLLKYLLNQGLEIKLILPVLCNPPFIDFLIEHGFDVNYIDTDGKSSLLKFAYEGLYNSFYHLLTKGANINHLDHNGYGVLEYVLKGREAFANKYKDQTFYERIIEITNEKLGIKNSQHKPEIELEVEENIKLKLTGIIEGYSPKAIIAINTESNIFIINDFIYKPTGIKLISIDTKYFKSVLIKDKNDKITKLIIDN